MALTKEQILAADDLPKEEVQVPEWGGSVYVRTLGGFERDLLEAEYSAHKHKNLRAKLAALTICDEQGNSLFSITEVEQLGRKSAKALDRIFTVASRLNGLSAQDVEDLEKN